MNQNILANLMGSTNDPKQTKMMDKENFGSTTARRPTSGLSHKTNTTTGYEDVGGGPRSYSRASSGNVRHNQHKLKQRFTVIRKLGKGTYGKVQLAINKETGQEVAIKTIKKTKIENEQDLQRVRREIQIMSSIEHPHIIHIYEVFENKEKIVLVMQYAPGGELYEYVSQSKLLNDQEARRIFRQIATAIYYCHQNKICHRDLKLENILLDEKNNAKLADFGLSNVFDKQRQLKTFCGSPLYASPEIVKGSPYEGPEVDCWSLGVLLYTLVYGAMPFDGSNFKRLVKQISEACYFEPKQKSQASLLIRSLLCADPSKRATIIDICSDPWVNGISPLGDELLTPPASTESKDNEQVKAQHHHHHTSLLKVAQDMANLTPVRFDILHALIPPTQQPNNQEEHKTALKNNTDNNQMTVQAKLPPIAGQNHIKKSARRSSVILDPTAAMEVDGEGAYQATNRPTSPVASYVVRDLTPTSQPQQKDILQQQMELTVDDNKNENGNENEKVSIETSGEQEKQKEDEDNRAELTIDQCPLELVLVQESQEDSEKSKAINLNDDDEKMQIDHSEEKLHDEDNKTTSMHDVDKIEATEDKKQPLANNDNDADKEVKQEQQHSNDVENTKMEIDTNVIQKDRNEDDETVEKLTSTGNEVGETNKQDQEMKLEQDDTKDSSEAPKALEEGKPKKVKKKIIVVKKKKKVSKKDPTETNDNKLIIEEQSPKQSELNQESATKEPPKEDGTGDNSKVENQKKKIVKSKGPGKVRIPETFKAKQEDEKNNNNNNNNDVKVDSGTRRQSALIADVSQKLLQQLQQTNDNNNNNSNNGIKSDQQQLNNVRVLDKKEEFERRASLMKGSQQEHEKQQKDVELVETLRELLEISDSNLEQTNTTTIIEPVKKLDAQEVKDLLSSEKGHQEQDVNKTEIFIEPEFLDSSGGDLSPKERAEIEFKLSECLKDFDNHDTLEVSAGRKSPLLLDSTSNVRDDRSDSVETIKPDITPSPPTQDDKIRSTFTINLNASAPTNIRSVDKKKDPFDNSQMSRMDSNSSLSIQAPKGPAPITRSYKKVTFTKDGACVTETGKIYSTQGNDGTIRRIERKSKITHYPPSGNDQFSSSGSGLIAGNNEGAIQQEEEEEEIIYEEPSNSKWFQHRSQQQAATSSCSGNNGTNRFGFEKLIMPSNDFIFDTTTGGLGSFINSSQAEQQSFKRSPYSQREQVGRADSASSCSSNSTDVFDDIFDYWTGAISMFNQNSGVHDSFHADPMLARHNNKPFRRPTFMRERGRTGSSLVGGNTPRCESADPAKHHTSSLFSKSNRKFNNNNTGGGYESSDEQQFLDKNTLFMANNQRPRSALGSARGMFGSSNLFENDPFFSNEDRHHHEKLFESLTSASRAHQSLKQRLKQQRKQMWKGSTPSLLVDDNLPESAPIFDHEQNRSERSQGLWQYLRPTQQDLAVQQQHNETLNQSQSSNSFLHNQQQHPLPPRNSMSKTSLAGQQQQQPPPNNRSDRQQSASFIEIKRTSSSTLSENNSGQHQQHKIVNVIQQPDCFVEKIVSTTSSTKVISRSGSSSAFFNSKLSPSTSASQHDHQVVSGKREFVGEEDMATSQQDNNSRIQNWLQDSIGNLSGTSSGFKSSSASDKTNFSSSKDPFNNNNNNNVSPRPKQQQAQQLKTSTSTTTATTNSLLPPAAPKRIVTTATIDIGFGQQNQPDNNNNNMNTTSVQQQEVKRDVTIDSLINDQSSLSKASSSSKMSSSKATFSLNQPFEELSTLCARQHSASKSIVQEQQVVEEHHHEQKVILSSSSIKPSTAPVSAGGKLNWIISNEDQSAMNNKQTNRVVDDIVGPLDEMSLSGSGDNLDSPGTSYSLLDQLRSKGYRSMINQRLVSTSTSKVISDSSSSISDNPLAANLQKRVAHSTSSTSTSNSTSNAPHAGSPPVLEGSSSKIVQMSSSSAAAITTTTTTTATTSGAADENESKRIIKQQKVITTSSSRSSKGISDKNDEDEESSSLWNKEKNVEAGKEGKRMENDENVGTVMYRKGSKEESDDKNQQVIATIENNDNLEEATSTRATENVEQEDEDEDVREAKANIKAHLDRMKETELFLKSMQQEEEEFERQRQQLYLFNNLMISTKLNGLCQKQQYNSTTTTTTTTTTVANKTSGAQSAPIRNYNPFTIIGNSSTFCSNEISTNNDMGIEFVPSAALSFEPTYSLNSNTSGSLAFNTIDPLEPVQPLYLDRRKNFQQTNSSYRNSNSINGGYNRNDFDRIDSSNESYYASVSSPRGRSRSQLSDQFSMADSYAQGQQRSRRPLSTCVDSNDVQYNNKMMPTRSKRSLSQVRYSTTKDNNFGNYSRQQQPRTFSSSSNMMSEYKSVYGRDFSNNKRESMTNHDDENIDFAHAKTTRHTVASDDSDDGMSAYRVSSYVPKVVPQGMPERTTTRGRSYQPNHGVSCKKETLSKFHNNKDKELKMNDIDYDDDDDLDKRQRRISLQSLPTRDINDGPGEKSSRVSESNRRASLTIGENSRLSELEQRIQENKKRREELLLSQRSITTSKSITKPTIRRKLSKDLDDQIDLLTKSLTKNDSSEDKEDLLETKEEDLKKSRPLSPPAQPTKIGTKNIGGVKGTSNVSSTSSRLVSRPSRLESMEARIKRKSYCVRVGDCSPERNVYLKDRGQSLEKWRQNTIKNQEATSSGNNSFSKISPRNSLGDIFDKNVSLLSTTRRDSNTLDETSFAKWKQRSESVSSGQKLENKSLQGNE